MNRQSAVQPISRSRALPAKAAALPTFSLLDLLALRMELLTIKCRRSPACGKLLGFEI